MKSDGRRPLTLSVEPPPPEPVEEAATPPAADAREPRRWQEGRGVKVTPYVPETKAAKPAKVKAERPPRAAAALAAAPVKPTSKSALPAAWAYVLGAFGALLWAGSFLAFVVGFGRLGPFDYAPFRDGIVVALAMFPAVLILLFVYALRQGQKLGRDVRTTRQLSEDLVGPLAVSAAQAGDLMIAMRSEIDRAADAAADAERRLHSLKDGIADESRRLTEAAQEAQAGARTLGEALGRERGELYTLSAALEARTLEVTEAVGRQSRLAADVSDLAQAQLTEAQAALAARAADLSAAAADVRESADAAADLLAQRTEAVGAAGDTLAARLARLSTDLSGERDRLAALTEGLKTDHEGVAARAESQRAQLVEATAAARDQGEAATNAAVLAADTLRSLIGEAAAQIRSAASTAEGLRGDAAADAEAHLSRIAAVAAQHRDATARQAHDSAEALTTAADRAQAAASARLAELQQQANLLGAAALDRIEQVNEAAFAAGQRADQAFDSRILAAKRAIDQSASVVEEAGLRAAQRIEAGLGAARSALAELDGLLSEVDGRFSQMPEEARQRAEAVRTVVERGVGDLTAAARRAAEETQAIDTAFQERVRKNYDTLSEAVRLMGRVAGAVEAVSRPTAPPEAAPPRPAPPAQVHDLAAKLRENAPVARPLADRAMEAPPMPLAVGDSHARFAAALAGASPTMGRATPDNNAIRLDAGGADLFAPTPTTPPAPSAADAGLRPRLKLTGAPEPLAPASALPKAAGEPIRADAPWSWKDLLSTLPDDGDVATDDEALADRLIGEIEALGLDAAALLPRAQVEDIASALQSGSGGAPRESVRRLAPAAVRRLSRRVLTDPLLRRDAAEFVRRYALLVGDASRRDEDGFLASALLGSDAGRAYLMLDAAIGDLPH